MAFDAAKARELMEAERAKREQTAAAKTAAQQGTTWTQDRMDELNTEIADSAPEETYTFDPEESRENFNAIGNLVSTVARDTIDADIEYTKAEAYYEATGSEEDEQRMEEARVNALAAPFKEPVRQITAAYADDNSSMFQGLAQSLRQSSANLEYFMTPEEKLEMARRINQRLPMIPPGAMLANTEAMQGALFAYDMAEKIDAVGGNIEDVYRQIPVLKTIADKDTVGAALALKDIKPVLQAKNVIDSIYLGWKHGDANYEYGVLKMKEAFEGLTDDERDEMEKLERTLKQTEQYYPSFFVNPMLAMASGVESLPEMIYSFGKSIPYGIAGAAVGAAVAGTPTFGAGAPAGAMTGFTWGRRAGMAYEMFRPMMGRKFAEYQEMTDANGAPLMTRSQAATLAAIETAPEALIEMGAAEVFLKNLSGAGALKDTIENVVQNSRSAISAKTAKDFARAVGKDLTVGTARETVSEAGEEFLQKYPDEIMDAYIQQGKQQNNLDFSLSRLSDVIENVDWSDITKKAVAQGAEAIPGALFLGGLSSIGGAPVSGVRYGLERTAWARKWGAMAKTERETLSGAIMLDQLQKTVQDSKLKDTAPEVQQEIIRDQVKDTPWQMAWIDVKSALKNENGEEDVREAARAAGIDEARVEKAIAEGGSLMVPVECYAQSKASPKLLDSVSFSQDAEPMAVIRENAQKISGDYRKRVEGSVKKQVELTEAMTNELFPDEGEERDAAMAAIYQNPENPAQGWKELYDRANAELDEIINPAVEALEAGMGNGVSIVETMDKNGDVTTTRASNNDPWYREWMKENKRPPTKAQIRDMAKLMVSGDVNAPQVQGWRPTTGEEAAAMESTRERVAALENEINTLDAIKERMQSLNGSEIKLTEGMSPEAYKVYRAINSSLRSIGGTQARAARINALMMARHADVVVERMRGLGYSDYSAMDYLQKLAIQRGVMGSMAAEAYNQSAFDVALSGIKSLVGFHDRIEEGKANGDPENKLKFVSPSSGIVFHEEQTVHAIDKHHLTDKNLADIDKHIGEMQDIEISAKQPGKFQGISVLGKVVGDDACYGVVLEIRITGEIYFKTAFKAKESAVDDWLKEEKNAEDLSLSKDSAGNSGRSSKLNIQEFAEEVKTRADLYRKLLPNWWYSESVPKNVKELRKNLRDLIAYHNISEENLMRSAELGGLPVPSIAVTRSDLTFDQFGRITLIGNSSMINPSRQANDVFSRDAWTATFPEVVYDKLKKSEIRDFFDGIKESYNALGPEGQLLLNAIHYKFDYGVRRDEAYWGLYTSPGMLYHYVTKELGKSVKIPMEKVTSEYDFILKNKKAREAISEIGDSFHQEENRKRLANIIRPIVEKYANHVAETIGDADLASEYMSAYFDENGDLNGNIFRDIQAASKNYGTKRVDIRKLEQSLKKKINDKKYEAFINDQLDKMYHNPQIEVGNRKKPLTLANVVSSMMRTRGAAQLETLTYGDSKILAALSKRFESLDEIRESKDKLTDSENTEKTVKAFEEKAGEYRRLAASHYDGDSWDAFDDAGKALVDAVKNGGTKEAIENALTKNGFSDITNEIIDACQKAIDAAKRVKTDYFEAKPARAVGFNEFSAAVVPKGTSKKAVDFLKSQGLEVKTYDPKVEGDRQRAIQEVQTEQPDVLFQNSNDNDTPNGRLNVFEDGKKIVEIFEGADESTFLHETGHIFLKDLEMLAGMGDEASIADLQTVNEWAEWHDGDAAKYKNTPWAKEFADREKAIKAAQKEGNAAEEERLLREWKQERFARAFEIYLYEGKAPSKGLRKVFEKFVDFLTQIYNVFTTDGAKASEQVEAVMSRLMATNEEIEAAELDDRYEKFEAAGGDQLLEENAKETFDRWHEEAKQEAKDRLRRIVMRDLKKRALDQREKFLGDERAKKEEELANQPVYLARQAIQESGIKDAWKAYFPGVTEAEWQKANGSAPPMEVALDEYVKNVAMVYDADQIKNDLPEETVEAAMSEAPYHERLVDLERQAFASKAALVNNLSGRAKTSMDSVQKMIDELPDDESPADNSELQDAINGLSVSTRWSRGEMRAIDKLAASKTKEEAQKNYKALRKLTEGRNVGLSDLREANRGRIEILRKIANDTIARQTLTQATQVQTHRADERNAAKDAKKYAKQKNWQEAARAKERELFASLMATEAQKTRDRMLAIVKKLKRQLDAKTKLPKDERYWHQHLAYLLRITDKDAEVPAGLESIQALAVSMGQGLDVVTDEDGQSDIIALLVKLADPNTNKDGYRGMTLDEFEDAADALTALYVTGRDKFNMKTVKGKTVQEVVEDILQDGTSYNGASVQQSRITGNPNRGGVFWNEMIARIPGAGDTLAQYAQRYGLSLTKPEELINLLGQKAHRYLYDTYDRAAEQEASMTADFVSNMQSIIGKYYQPKELRNWQARVYNFNGEPLSKENVLAMAMNMGNDINMDRLIMGLGVDASAVEKFLTENMTEKDWLFCQDVWDLLSTYWPDTVRVEMELNGTKLKPQTARAFTVKTTDAKGNPVNVDLRGGYYPIKYDPEKSIKAGEQAENALAKSGMSGAMVLGMGRGFTKDRAAKGAIVDRPLLLSLSVIPEHCGEAIHNITTRIAARDVYRLINDNTFRQYVESTLGIDAYKVLRTWATDVWKVQPEKKGGAASWSDQFIRSLRMNSGIAIMGYRMWPTIENATNIFPMMDALGATETMSALSDYYANKKEFDELIAKSMFMKERTERMERDMKGQRSMFEKRNAISEWLVEHAYDPITFTDLLTSKPLWARAYKNAFPTELEDLRKENEENAATFDARRAEFEALNAEIIDMRNRRTSMQEELRRRDLQQPVLAETEFTRMSRAELNDEIKNLDRQISEKGHEVFVAGEKIQRASQLVIRTEKEMLDEAEHRAILSADKAVREVIGSGDVKDQSEIQRTNDELKKAMTMFYSYFNTQANAIIQAHWRGKWQGGPGYNFLPLARALVYRFMLTAALSTAMRWVFFAEGDDDKDKYKKDKDGNKIEIPVLNRVLKQYAKNMLSTSIGGLYFFREFGNFAINYFIDGQVYGGGARFDGFYGSFATQIGKELQLIFSKAERDQKAAEDEAKRRAKYDKMTPAQKKRFREEQKYRKPPNTISYADILRGAGEIGTRFTAGRFGVTDPIADAVLGTMQYIFDSDGRYDATLRNMMWSAFWTKKPVKRKPPEKPEKPKKKGR